MEKYRSPQQWHKNVLKKEEEIFLMSFLIFSAGVFLYISISTDNAAKTHIQTLTTSYRQFSIVEHAYAARNH
ncbi:MAG TPA: hypothetical protein VLF89_07930 [Candidatus Saccharimonadales bacterium]|nr:hypothetical protein [Candidatus Saccharimonadales bacterium]